MANAAIQITLNGGEPLPGGLMRFDPGSAMTGTVQVAPQETIYAKAVFVRLGWHTEGRGDRDSGLAAEIPIAQGTLPEGQPIYHSFNFKLPAQPWSFARHYINIIWEVKVTIDIPMAPDVNGSQPFILAPRT
jgi:hypothetical protein